MRQPMSLAEPHHPLHNTPPHWGVLLVLVLPWVQPYAPGPVSNVMPWLISWACLALAAFGWRQVTVSAVFHSWAIAALISSVIGLIQYFGKAEAFWPLVHVPDYLGDAVGNLRQRNQLATLLSMGLLAVLWWRLHGLTSVQAWIMTAVLCTALAATSSRTGLLQLVGITLWMALQWRQARMRQLLRLCVFALGVYTLAAWVLPWSLQHMTGQATFNAMVRMTTDDGCGSRKVLWSNVLHLLAQKPLSGWGWDALRHAHYITDYGDTRFCAVMGNAHNLPLHLAVVWGIPAAAALMLALMAAVWMARPWQAQGADRCMGWGVLGVIAVHSALEYPLWYGPFQIALVLCLWVMGGQIWWSMRASNSLKSAALLVLSALACLAYDYQQVRQIYLPPAQRWAVWRDKPLEVAQRSWFFETAALFAELTTTRVTPDNARWVLEASQELLLSTPDPRVVLQLIEAAQLLDEDDVWAFHLARLQQVYPEDHARWVDRQAKTQKSKR